MAVFCGQAGDGWARPAQSQIELEGCEGSCEDVARVRVGSVDVLCTSSRLAFSKRWLHATCCTALHRTVLDIDEA